MTKALAALAAGLMLMLAASPVLAQVPAAVAMPAVSGLDGDWEGTLDAGPSGKLRLVLHVKTDAKGTTATLDSLDQGTNGIPVSGMSHTGDKVSFDIDIIQGSYDGALSADGRTLTGQWSQGPGMLPLVLTRRP